MADPMTAERLTEIREHQQRYPNIDVRDLLDEVERLREEERRQRETAEAASRGWRIEVAEVERLRAELATRTDERDEARRTWMKDYILKDAAEDERDRLAEQVASVQALADEWGETITSGVMRGQEWEQCLRANLPRLRAALDGPEGDAKRFGADLIIDHITQCHPDVKGMLVAQSGSLNDQVDDMIRAGWTVDRVEHVAGKRIRIMKPPAQEASG